MSLELKAEIFGKSLLLVKVPKGSWAVEGTVSSQSECEGSALLEQLYETGKIAQIAVLPDELKIRLAPGADARDEAKTFGEIIREVFKEETSAKRAIFPEGFGSAGEGKGSADSAGASNASSGGIGGKYVNESVQEIEKVLDSAVRPGLAQHGGNLKIVSYDQGVLVVEFLGGCQGCSQISLTLKQGVERLIRETLPFVSEVRDVTDHEAGTNPYA